MMVFKDSLFIIDPGGGVGGFDDLNGIVGFDGENWFDPGGFTIFGPECMEVYKGELYVAGEFGYSWPDWLPVRNVARFDGTTWHDLNGGFANGRVWCMSKDEDHDMLYMGGSFSQSWDGVTAYRVIRWDGENWHSLGVPWLNDIILSMCFYRGQLYVSGVFTADQYGNPRNHILRWDGAQWQNLGDGLDGVAFKMQVFKDELYVGGQFNWVGDSTFLVNDVARWYMDPDSVTWGVPVYSPDKDDDNEQTTGFIERINEKDWKIFPNPTNGILHVEFSQVQSGAIVLTDLQGRQKQYITIDGHQSVDLNVSSYPAGEYLVNVVRDGSIVGTKRMVVK